MPGGRFNIISHRAQNAVSGFSFDRYGFHISSTMGIKQRRLLKHLRTPENITFYNLHRCSFYFQKVLIMQSYFMGTSCYLADIWLRLQRLRNLLNEHVVYGICRVQTIEPEVLVDWNTARGIEVVFHWCPALILLAFKLSR